MKIVSSVHNVVFYPVLFQLVLAQKLEKAVSINFEGYF